MPLSQTAARSERHHPPARPGTAAARPVRHNNSIAAVISASDNEL